MRMAHTFKLARRAARFRAPMLATLLALALGACEADELTNTTSEDLSSPVELADPAVAVEAPSFASSFSGGIPIGTFAQPISAFGTYFNGAKMTIAPSELMKYLSAIKARGGKVVLMFAGNDHYYKDGRGFNMTKWKARVDRFKGINFASYINDGTIIGHFLIDEPNDATNWHGKTIPASVVDEMARYSKSRWSSMATIARVEPAYFKSRPRYLDAAWAQYVTRKGTAPDYIRRNVADAQRAGVGLVVGLNISKGGPNKRGLTASEIKSFGSALLSSSYPCAFLSWEYGSKFLSTTSMKDAMKTLRGKAQSRSSKSCRG